jgi:hypothetical protein
MGARDYHFIDRWRVKATVDEVYDVVAGPGTDLPRWWPTVYSDARELAKGGERDVGAVFSVRGRGWMPYRLKLTFTKTADNRPDGYTLAVAGDLEGTGEWSFVQDGEWVDVTFDWRVRANKAGVRQLSPLLKPLFRSNHRWSMREGEKALRTELRRRRAGP